MKTDNNGDNGNGEVKVGKKTWIQVGDAAKFMAILLTIVGAWGEQKIENVRRDAAFDKRLDAIETLIVKTGEHCMTVDQQQRWLDIQRELNPDYSNFKWAAIPSREDTMRFLKEQL